jgi:hypothetical protein
MIGYHSHLRDFAYAFAHRFEYRNPFRAHRQAKCGVFDIAPGEDSPVGSHKSAGLNAALARAQFGFFLGTLTLGGALRRLYI